MSFFTMVEGTKMLFMTFRSVYVCIRLLLCKCICVYFVYYVLVFKDKQKPSYLIIHCYNEYLAVSRIFIMWSSHIRNDFSELTEFAINHHNLGRSTVQDGIFVSYYHACVWHAVSFY